MSQVRTVRQAIHVNLVRLVKQTIHMSQVRLVRQIILVQIIFSHCPNCHWSLDDRVHCFNFSHIGWEWNCDGCCQRKPRKSCTKENESYSQVSYWLWYAYLIDIEQVIEKVFSLEPTHIFNLRWNDTLVLASDGIVCCYCL